MAGLSGRMRVRKRLILSCVLALLATLALPNIATADSQLTYWGEVHNTGHDKGYSERNEIKSDDVHFGWTLGQFVVTGYTRVTQDAEGNPIFLKNVGDEVTLSFQLNQDIDYLNGDEKLRISNDRNGYNEYFGVPRTDFGRGMMITGFTDYQQLTHEPTLYADFLAASATLGANTIVELCEEGDYEVALNYEIVNDKLLFFDSYSDYQIYFKFSVRNGNCMVFPLDIEKNAELTNGSLTESGFFLDMAKSRYLNIDIRREVLGQSGDTLDVRWNRPAKDGEEYVEEGIYTITASNLYTNESTVKQIYVGTDPELRAVVVTGLSLQQVKDQIAAGFTVTEAGELIPPDANPTTASEKSTVNESDPESLESVQALEEGSDSHTFSPALFVGLGIVVLFFIMVIVLVRSAKRRRSAQISLEAVEVEPLKLQGDKEECSEVYEYREEDK